MKLVQKPLTAWLSALCALLALIPHRASSEGPKPAYLAYFDPAQGFKPAQTSLTDIFLQLAGSLEHYGSPEPYIRHMQAEHARVSKKFEAKMGKPHQSRMPSHMTPEYLDRFIDNWNLLSPKLGLDALAKEAGRCARQAIRGSHNTGTMVIEIFNEQQDIVVEGMKKGSSIDAGFERLRARIEAELGFATADEATKTIAAQQAQYAALLAEREKALTEPERKQFASLLRNRRFTKANFDELQRFYGKPYDKLSEKGKDQLSHRVWAGTRPDDSQTIRADAGAAAKKFMSMKAELFQRIDAGLPADQAAQVEEAVNGAFRDIARLAHSELEAGILDWSLSH